MEAPRLTRGQWGLILAAIIVALFVGWFASNRFQDGESDLCSRLSSIHQTAIDEEAHGTRGALLVELLAHDCSVSPPATIVPFESSPD